MELQNFVHKTLEEIVSGVREAEKNMGQDVIDPYRNGMGKRQMQIIEFDVAVTVEEKSGASVGGKISVLGYGIGGGTNADKSLNTVTRIKFTVPVAFASEK